MGVLFLMIVLLAFLVSLDSEERDVPTAKPFTFSERIFYKVLNDLMFNPTLTIQIIYPFLFSPYNLIILTDFIPS